MAKKNANSAFKATVGDSNYATKSFSEFTLMNGEEHKNFEQIMKLAKARAEQRRVGT